MKLCEIYTTPKDEWANKVYRAGTDLSSAASNKVAQARKQQSHKFLGAGGFGYVGTDDDDNFGDVKRIANADDGGSMYLKYIAEHPEVMDNPFFPQVRAVADYDYDDNVQVTITERLIPFDTPAISQNSKLMQAIWTRYFTEPWTNEVKNNFTEWLTEELRMALVSTSTAAIKDPYLEQAVTLLKKMRQYLRTEIDMHAGNIMWRPHPYQPQLVFTDPFVY